MAKAKNRRLPDRKHKSQKQAKKKENKSACPQSYSKSNSKVIKTLFQNPIKSFSVIDLISTITKEIVIDQIKEPVWHSLIFIWHLFF